MLWSSGGQWCPRLLWACWLPLLHWAGTCPPCLASLLVTGLLVGPVIARSPASLMWSAVGLHLRQRGHCPWVTATLSFWLPSLMEEPRSCYSPTTLMIKSALITDMPLAEIVPFSALLPVLLLNCCTRDHFLPCSLLRKTFGIASSKIPYKNTTLSHLVPYSTKSAANLLCENMTNFILHAIC